MTAPAIPAASSARAPFGILSIVLAGIVLLVTLAGRIVAVALPTLARTAHLSPASIAGALNAMGVVGLVLALAAAAIGIIGVTRPGSPHGLAAAGMAVGITSAATTVLVFALDSSVANALVPR